tara:strand:+ start:15 stop:377 length:363 start_codon:yes stop_codon:yes gene_type:complete
MQKKLGNKRYFINPKEGVAAASFDVSITDDINKKKGYPNLDLEATLTLSDCNRQISLDFETWLGKDIKEAKKVIKDRRLKLTRLKKIVDEFVAVTERGYAHIESRLPEYEKAVKEYEKKK